MKKLNDDLQSIHSVMRKTIDDVLDRWFLALGAAGCFIVAVWCLPDNYFHTLCRGNKIEDVADISKNIAEESKKYKWGAKKLSIMVSFIIVRQICLKFYLKVVLCDSFLKWRKALYKQWAPILIIAIVALIIIVVRFVWWMR
jgi:hypothetical protein